MTNPPARLGAQHPIYQHRRKQLSAQHSLQQVDSIAKTYGLVRSSPVAPAAAAAATGKQRANSAITVKNQQYTPVERQKDSNKPPVVRPHSHGPMIQTDSVPSVGVPAALAAASGSNKKKNYKAANYQQYDNNMYVPANPITFPAAIPLDLVPKSLPPLSSKLLKPTSKLSVNSNAAVVKRINKAMQNKADVPSPTFALSPPAAAVPAPPSLDVAPSSVNFDSLSQTYSFPVSSVPPSPSNTSPAALAALSALASPTTKSAPLPSSSLTGSVRHKSVHLFDSLPHPDAILSLPVKKVVVGRVNCKHPSNIHFSENCIRCAVDHPVSPNMQFIMELYYNDMIELRFNSKLNQFSFRVPHPLPAFQPSEYHYLNHLHRITFELHDSKDAARFKESVYSTMKEVVAEASAANNKKLHQLI